MSHDKSKPDGESCIRISIMHWLVSATKVQQSRDWKRIAWDARVLREKGDQTKGMDAHEDHSGSKHEDSQLIMVIVFNLSLSILCRHEFFRDWEREPEILCEF